MNTKYAPPIAFLGVCDRASRTPLFQAFSQLNIIALRDIVVAPFLPVTVRGVQFVFAMYSPALAAGLLLTLKDSNLRQVGEIRIQAQSHTFEEHFLGPLKEQRSYTAIYPGAWVTDAIEIGAEPPWILTESGVHTFYFEEPDHPPVPIGSFNIGLMQAEPLSDARVAAIRSDPQARKIVQATFACNKCKDSISAYVGLERSTRREESGCIWYSDLPDAFRCTCGEFGFSLATLRGGMHSLLGRHDDAANFNVVPLYESLAIQAICTEFLELLNEDPPEEELHHFIGRNLVLLHTVAAAEKIFSKAAILTKYKTDFVILTPSRELLLIEIEKTSTRLMKSDGGLASPLQHAFDQVTDWLHAVNEHRAAVLDGFGLRSDQVTGIRGVVIAGRDKDYDYEHLRKLKTREFVRVKLLTFDDLAASLNALALEIRKV